MVYNQHRSFAVARLREPARECKVHKKPLKLKGPGAGWGRLSREAASLATRPRAWRWLSHRQASGQTSGTVLWGGKSVGGLG